MRVAPLFFPILFLACAISVSGLDAQTAVSQSLVVAPKTPLSPAPLTPSAAPVQINSEASKGAPTDHADKPAVKELQVLKAATHVSDPVQSVPELATEDSIQPGITTTSITPVQAAQSVQSVQLASPSPTLGSTDQNETPPKPEELPIYLQRVDTLLRQHDESMAISYLRRIVPSGILSTRDRSQAIIELADCLTDSAQQGEALVWLRLWMGLYPSRPEAGAVDFRIGCLYEYMHMPREARDTFYLALSATVNQSKIQDSVDLGQYSCLTADILWKMAENEYACGEFGRAAQLFDRYLREATAASVQSKEQAQFLEADANYQMHDVKNSTALYEKAIGSHPFNPLVPEARLRLYHLYIIQGRVADAEGDLQALAWTVRTVWPGDEKKWQKRALELLLEINKGDPGLQVPILAAAGTLHVGSDLQSELDHYTQLNALQDKEVPVALQRSSDKKVELAEIRGEDLKIDTLSQSINHLLPNE